MKYYIFKKGKDGYLYPLAQGKVNLSEYGILKKDVKEISDIEGLRDFTMCKYIDDKYGEKEAFSIKFCDNWQKDHKVFIDF